ncbi:amidohydrolase family protein [Paenibacillus sp. SAFN-117]|uniref:amidohydrolase family protein n=1 Tax=Paenibacillus sp. SAFN-117 TaxID=3436860 RepID=UPI003F7E1A8B
MRDGLSFESFVNGRGVDVTAFIGQWPFRYRSQASAEDLMMMADRLGLVGLCVSHLASVFGHDTRSGNEALFAQAAADERLWPFVVLNPAEPGWEAELDYAARNGARGVRLLPGYHGYAINGQHAAELIAALRERGLPLSVIARLQDERLQHPRYPAETVPVHALAELIGTCGGHPLLISGLRDYEWDAVMRFRTPDWRMDRVIFDLWYINGPLAVIAQLCQRGGARAFAYSSCAPLQEMGATALQLAAANISEADRLALCRDNALRFLGMNDCPVG